MGTRAGAGPARPPGPRRVSRPAGPGRDGAAQPPHGGDRVVAVELLAVQVALGLLVSGVGPRQRAGGDRIEIAPAHLANEDRLLSALSPAERQQLADLLRRLLAGFESATIDVAAGLGLTLEPAHLARARRQAVGLSDTPGLLVTEVAPGSAAARAGIERGDLITAIDGASTTSSAGLALLLDELAGCPAATVTLLRGNDRATAELDLTPAQ
jgi:membrane-associated protease RseP (regulator of RpoE activity)